jgi:hypothetical protein
MLAEPGYLEMENGVVKKADGSWFMAIHTDLGKISLHHFYSPFLFPALFHYFPVYLYFRPCSTLFVLVLSSLFILSLPFYSQCPRRPFLSFLQTPSLFGLSHAY